MDSNNAEDFLSKALEYRRTLRREFDFNSTWEQQGEATGGAGSLGAQGRRRTGARRVGWRRQRPRRTGARCGGRRGRQLRRIGALHGGRQGVLCCAAAFSECPSHSDFVHVFLRLYDAAVHLVMDRVAKQCYLPLFI
jgi:hypothetical protein